ncbi:E3 ubiquitin-protein ligase ORTHRUS 2 [Orobanche minor]
MAKLLRSITSGGPQTVYHFLHNQDRPDRAFTTERAQKARMANAASGRIFVTVPKDHFRPIPAEIDPERNQGVLVGEFWDLHMDVRQWGVHYPPVAGIARRANYGARSVVISRGYEDDEDNGEWFIYTGSDVSPTPVT